MQFLEDKIYENDNLRSKFMWNLISSSHNYNLRTKSMSIPHKIIQFWDDTHLIPADVQTCMSSWKELKKKGFTYDIFNDKTASDFIKKHFSVDHLQAFYCCIHPAMRADYFRLCYLLINGGLYVDADDVCYNFDFDYLFDDDCLKLQPLCYEITSDSMIPIDQLNFNDDADESRIYYVNNDPIISPPRHPIIRIALACATKMLLAVNTNKKDIQSITGPGNLTACLVKHVLELNYTNSEYDFSLLHEWDNIAKPKWTLEYRNSNRNWRSWNGIPI